MKRLSSFFKRRASQRGSDSGNAAAAPPAQQPLQQGATQVSQAPAVHEVLKTNAAQGPTLTVALQNQTSSNTVFAYITGQAIDQGNQWVLLQSDAVTPYYPTSPSSIMQPLQADCAIRLGAPGSTIQAQIPHIAGGRIWFSIDQPIQFFLNPGPALVEPSVTNSSDPNAQLNWGFAEFTWNADQLYANISYVDFVGIPIALTLNTVSSGTQHVSGMNPSGLQQVADGLRQQAASDGAGWDQLIVNQAASGQLLRVLSPNQGMVGNPNLFTNYYDGYVDQVFQRYANAPLTIDTQSGSGTVASQVVGGSFNFAGSVFSRPSTRDVFTCNSGPFTTGSNAQTNAIIPRISAAFNRSTLLVTSDFPAPLNLYYQNSITNHYSRIVHAANLDGKGYAFPYDDVQPSGGPDQSGEVHAGDPTLFTVAVGGNNAYVA